MDLFGIELEKAWADSEGALRFRGVASTTSLDKHGERMTPQALRKMAGYSNLELRGTHAGLTELGFVEKLSLEGDTLFVEGEFDRENPEGVRVHQRLLKDLSSGSSPRYSLSVGGKVTGAAWRFDKDARARTRFIEDVTLDHIAVCRAGKQSNPDAYIEALMKALDDEWPAPEPLEKEISQAAWDGKRSDFAKACYLVQADTWSDCKLPVYEPDTSSPKDVEGHYTKRGPLNANGVRAAIAAVGGARTGQAMDVSQSVKDKLSALAAECEIDTQLGKEGDPQDGDLEKAGRRHSQGDIGKLHDARVQSQDIAAKAQAVDGVLADACGCEDCTGTTMSKEAEDLTARAIALRYRASALRRAVPIH